LIGSFLFRRFLGFYILFELSLVPLLFLILGWGYQIERVRASYYLLIYTIFGSFPLLLRIVILSGKNGNRIIWEIFQDSFLKFSGLSLLFMVVFFISLIIKLPLYLFHLWLPKAHVEAPVSGSIILAAVVLKLRAYAFFRLNFLIFELNFKVKEFFFSFLLYGAILASIICLFQGDIKALVAYSSIRHMGIMISGFFAQNLISLQGVWVIVLAHGFGSSALFYLANFNYEQNLRRQVVLNRGQGQNFIWMRIFWCLFLFINFSIPPFLNLIGEVEVLVILISVNFQYFWVASFLIILVAAFCVYAFRTIIQGKSSLIKVRFGEIEMFFLIMFFHFWPLFFLVLKIDLLVT